VTPAVLTVRTRGRHFLDQAGEIREILEAVARFSGQRAEEAVPIS